MNEKDITDIIEGINTLERLSQRNLQHWRYTLECANSIWQRCPYQIEQRVMLVKTPEISLEKSWGWLGAKHFLVEGAGATIKFREFYKGSFVFGLHFDSDSWMDSSGTKHPIVPEKRGAYSFNEKWIKPYEI